MVTTYSCRAEALREERLRRKIRITYMADWFGLSYNILYYWEKNKMPLYGERLYQHYFDTHPPLPQEKTS